MRPLPDFGLLPRTSVTVVRRTRTGTDAFNAPVYAEEREAVGGVLVRQSSTADLDTERPQGTSRRISVAFPKTYAKTLKGCSIEHGGTSYRVVGDPMQLMSDAVPDPWGMTVECEAVDG